MAHDLNYCGCEASWRKRRTSHGSDDPQVSGLSAFTATRWIPGSRAVLDNWGIDEEYIQCVVSFEGAPERDALLARWINTPPPTDP